MMYFLVLLENVQSITLRLKIFVTTVKKDKLFFLKSTQELKFIQLKQTKHNEYCIV